MRKTTDLPNWLKGWSTKTSKKPKSRKNRNETCQSIESSCECTPNSKQSTDDLGTTEFSFSSSANDPTHCEIHGKNTDAQLLQIHLPNCVHYRADTSIKVCIDNLIASAQRSYDGSSKKKGEQWCEDTKIVQEASRPEKKKTKEKILVSVDDLILCKESYTAADEREEKIGCGCPHLPCLDDLRNYAYEGEGSSPGSLSSCCSGKKLKKQNRLVLVC